MKISTKGRYGLRALVDLAAHTNGEPIPLANMAERQQLSRNYLEQVFGTLRKAGIVNSIKGSNGGYLLARDAGTINVREVLEALEGVFSIADSAGEQVELDSVQQAIHNLVWNRIDEQVNNFLTEATLESIVREYRELSGVTQEMYYI